MGGFTRDLVICSGGAIVVSQMFVKLGGQSTCAPTTDVRRVQDGQMTSLAASSASTNDPVRLRPASLPDDAPDSP